MAEPIISPLPADLRLLRQVFKVVPRGHRVARSLWWPRLKALGVVSVPTPLDFTLLVRLTDVMGWALAMHPNYEGPITSLIAQHLQDGGLFADIGANHGWFSLYAAKLLGRSGGRVFAFEPQADLAGLIRKAVTVNRLDNITVVEAAVADRPSRGMLRSDWEGNSGLVGAIVTDRASDPIRVVTLDQEIGNTTPSVIKIDVEGGELRVLRGMERLMARPVLRCIIVEVHPPQMGRLGDDPDELLTLLRAQGFRTYLIAMEKQTAPLPELREFTGALPGVLCLNLCALR
jgi:FkbM family methyltransferase